MEIKEGRFYKVVDAMVDAVVVNGKKIKTPGGGRLYVVSVEDDKVKFQTFRGRWMREPKGGAFVLSRADFERIIVSS